jgi:hypothetical protein
VVIGRTAGDKLEVKYPVRTAGDVTYWIKALSPAGLYSQAAIFASTRQAPIANRNVVLANDWTALNYPGVKLDLQQNASALELTKVNGRNSQRGDYYAEITLPATYYARSWTEVSSASVSNSGATWASSQYSWDNAGSLTWQGALGDTDAGVSTAYISPYIGTLPSGVIEGWRLSENATGVTGTTAAVSQDLTFSPCHTGRVGCGNPIGVVDGVRLPSRHLPRRRPMLADPACRVGLPAPDLRLVDRQVFARRSPRQSHRHNCAH